MSELLLKLLDPRVSDAGRLAGVSLGLRGGMSVGWFVVLLLAGGVLVWLLYRASPVTLPRWRKHLLAALRILFLGLLLALLLRPVLAFTVEGSVRRVLALLIDGSSSMQIQDPRLDVPDQKRAALAKNLLDPKAGLNQPLDRARAREFEQVARLDLVKAALKNERINLLPRLDAEFDLAAYTFGQAVAELSLRKAEPANTNAAPVSNERAPAQPFDWVDRLSASAPATAIGDAVREVFSRKRGQPLAGIVLITDGANNSGSHPGDAALQARAEAVPLYTYGVGITRPRDLIVQSLFAPDISFVRDEVSATIRVRSQGIKEETAELELKLGDQVVANRTLTFTGDEEIVVPLKFTPQNLGEYDLTARIEPRPGETVKDNNSQTQRIKVIDAKIKVLLVDQSPRWEFRYLQAMFLRDRRVDLKCFLAEGDKSIGQAADSPYLSELPARRDELFTYDLIVIGDVDPKVLSLQHQENLNKLVSDFGGGLVIVAGKRFMPSGYRRSVLERMLPVDFDAPALESAADPVLEKPIRLQLTSAGRNHPMLRLADQEIENARLWAQLPPVFWVAKVARAKPAAEVLLVDPDPAKESRFGKMPVIAGQQYGLGQVLFVGTDNTWRWRKNVGDFYYSALWGQVAQRISIQRLLGVSKRTQLSTDRQHYLTGDRVSVYARLYTGVGFDPIQDPAVKGLFAPKNGQGPRSDLALRSIPEQPGMYRGEFIAPAAGLYEFWVETDAETRLDFSVTEPRFEFGETAMNEGLLRDLAATTGGEFFREEDLHRLPDVISAKAERVRSPMEVELWASPLYFLLMLAVATTEWVMRKLSHLK